VKKAAFLITFFLGALFGYFGLRFFEKKALIEAVVLSQKVEQEIPTPTLFPTSTPTPTPKPTSTPIPKPTLTPTPTLIPQPIFTSQEINSFIDRFAGQYGVSPHVLRHIALCESGFNPNAKNLSYGGLYQFSPNTWIKYRQLLGEETSPDLRFNAEEAVQTAAYVLSLNQAYIWPSCVP